MQQMQALELRLSLTPAMRQSLDILSYSMSDLASYIQQQAELNPLMEIKKPKIERASIQGSDKKINELYEEPLHTMEQSLFEQVTMVKHLSNKQRKLLMYFIQHLNDAGYLVCEIEEAAKLFRASFEEAMVVLQTLQSFEPAGIGARSLAECLYLQLREKKHVPTHTADILLHHLEDLAARKFAQLASIYGCSEVQIEHVLTFIQTLNPRPVFDVYTEKIQYVIPDLILEILGEEAVLQVNDGFLPEISVSTAYDDLMNENDEVAQFMKGKISEILLLKKGIEQRHVTLYKVVQAVLQAQPNFLTAGKKGLLPLRLKEIAEQTGFHESTISRTINSKYIQTPHGLLLLKQFFVRGLLNEQGVNQNIQIIHQQLMKLIEQEDKTKPYSDEQLVQLLANENIAIARRTVAKYREQLCIPSSVKRRSRRK